MPSFATFSPELPNNVPATVQEFNPEANYTLSTLTVSVDTKVSDILHDFKRKKLDVSKAPLGHRASCNAI